MNKREIKKTLKTGNKLEARRMSLVVGAKVEKAITRARAVAMNQELSEAEKQEIIKGLFNFILTIQDSHLDSAISGYASYLDLDYPAHRDAAKAMGVDPQPDINRLKNLEELSLGRSLEEHKNRDFESLKNLLQGSVLFHNQDLPDEAVNGSFLNALSLARIDAAKIIHARAQGENAPILELYALTNQNAVPPVAPKEADTRPPTPLTQVIDEFTNDRLAREKWTEKTVKENHALYQNFLDFSGAEVTCAEIDYHRVSEFRAALKKLPSNRKKSKKYRNKTIHQILEMDVEKPMSATTVNKNLNRLSTLLNFAVKLDYMPKNPAQGMEISIDEKDADQRAVFTIEDLQKLFDSEQYRSDTFRHPFMFWSCPIALFTGMRQTEIAQLHLSDIYEKDDTWIIDINDNKKDKKVKNKNARRLVPLHPFLVESLNLPAYVEQLKAEGRTRLFPEISYGRDGYGQAISRWFGGHGDGVSNGYKMSCGITEKKKVFHSFRHTTIDHLKQQQVDLPLLHEFDGHSSGSETMDRYGKAYAPALMLEKIVSQISFHTELSLDHLIKSKYVI
ncbi:MAG: tyrosine-type recombinase/integrase [Pseudodesulfovibrio sp.]